MEADLDIVTPFDYEDIYKLAGSGDTAVKRRRYARAATHFYKQAFDQAFEKIVAPLWYKRSHAFLKAETTNWLKRMPS